MHLKLKSMGLLVSLLIPSVMIVIYFYNKIESISLFLRLGITKTYASSSLF